MVLPNKEQMFQIRKTFVVPSKICENHESFLLYNLSFTVYVTVVTGITTRLYLPTLGKQLKLLRKVHRIKRQTS